MGEKRRQYALCVQVEGDEDLEVGKVYEVLPDALAAKRCHLRIVDDSGEDYLYPADSFILLDLPAAAERALHRRKHSATGVILPSQRVGSARR